MVARDTGTIQCIFYKDQSKWNGMEGNGRTRVRACASTQTHHQHIVLLAEQKDEKNIVFFNSFAFSFRYTEKKGLTIVRRARAACICNDES